jgi:hypothetical protein
MMCVLSQVNCTAQSYWDKRIFLRTCRSWIVLSLIVLMPATDPVQAEVFQSEEQARDECSAAGGQGDMHDCLVAKVEKSKFHLEQMEGRVLASIRQWFDSQPYKENALRKFRKSDLAFARDRDAHCAFMGALTGGAAGNSSENMRLACMYELNMRRVAQLRGRASNLPSD